MKVSEYIINFLIKNDMTTVFAVTGGAIAPLIDAASKKIRVIFFQHEQAAAMACEGFFRETGKIGVVMVTSGPGIQNAYNGICGCWYDGIPAIFISGQVSMSESLDKLKSKPRQKGFQEMPVTESIGPFTKFCKKITDTNLKHITDIFSNAVAQMINGRPGPVLIDFPVNIQMSTIHNITEIVQTISESKKPLVVYGMGMRYAESDRLNIPFVTSWAAKDLFPHDDPFNIGSIGIYGAREANFAVQNCDCLIILGSRLDTRQTGYTRKFSNQSKKIMVDIDENEIEKLNESGIQIDFSIVSDLKTFMSILPPIEWSNQEWMNTLNNWKVKYAHPKKGVYTFLSSINFPCNTTIIPDTGGNVSWAMQSIDIRKGQRMYTNLGNSSMGFSLPCSIGAAFSDPTRVITCIIGDGGLQMNIQELKTVVDYNLNIKILVINNNGYGIIKQFQDAYFQSNYIGTEFTRIDFCSIAKAYNMKATRVTVSDLLDSSIFSEHGPILVDIIIDPNQQIYPKLEFGNSLEHMYPPVELDFIPIHDRIERNGWVNIKDNVH